jgi:hypothetical protein
MLIQTSCHGYYFLIFCRQGCFNYHNLHIWTACYFPEVFNAGFPSIGGLGYWVIVWYV